MKNRLEDTRVTVGESVTDAGGSGWSLLHFLGTIRSVIGVSNSVNGDYSKCGRRLHSIGPGESMEAERLSLN